MATRIWPNVVRQSGGELRAMGWTARTSVMCMGTCNLAVEGFRITPNTSSVLFSRGTTMSSADPTPNTPTHEELKQAYKAFKKRLKVTRLDAESQVTRNPLSTGRGSGIVAITPP